MSRRTYPSKLRPSDITVGKDDKALANTNHTGAAFLASIGTPGKLERYWAESWVRGHVEDPDEILAMLGLVEVEERTEDDVPVERAAILAAVDHPDRVVACPTCHAPPGALCKAYNGVRTNSYPRGHIARHRRAKERA